ncbi:MAG TPA: extracellular solute-binding protein, partial [Trueperaceae bacterium]|nr:extracellular solute-binding protein [Trueperaceae bacterium]
MKRIFILSLFFSMAFAQEISIWTSFDGLELDWLKSQTKLYSDLFKVEVEIENFSIGEINQKMLLSKKDDDIELADIIVGLSQREIPKLNEEDLLANMQAFTTQEYLDDLSKNAREAFSIDDKLFGFPLYLEGPALIINTDLV